MKNDNEQRHVNNLDGFSHQFSLWYPFLFTSCVKKSRPRVIVIHKNRNFFTDQVVFYHLGQIYDDNVRPIRNDKLN